MSPEQEQTPDETPAAADETAEDTQALEDGPAAEVEADSADKPAADGSGSADEPAGEQSGSAARPAGEQPGAEAEDEAPAKSRRGRRKKAATDEPVAAEASEKDPTPRRRRSKKAADVAPAGEASAAAKPGKPASARRSAKGAKRPQRRRVVRAHARYVRTSARKARLVSDHLRGRSVQEARAILAYAPREVARDWSKLLDSAVANAENNHELLEDDLIVREAYADEGPTIKRFRPRAMGRATSIRKRTSHLTITLTPDI
jgi:ribosomal protein L22